MSKLYDVLLHRNITGILLYIHYTPGTNNTNISKDVDITYCYVFRLLKELVVEGLIKIDKTHRSHRIYLTEKGKRVVKLISKLKSEFSKVATN